jgi:hypothetical protein
MAGKRLPILADGRERGVPSDEGDMMWFLSIIRLRFKSLLPDVSVRGEVLADPLSSFSQKIVFTGPSQRNERDISI